MPNRRCVRPDHLFLGTQSANLFDQGRKGRNIMQTKPWLHPGNAGEKNGNAKLTDNQVIDIKKLYNDGMTQQSIASQYSVTQSYISKIVLNQSRKTEEV